MDLVKICRTGHRAFQRPPPSPLQPRNFTALNANNIYKRRVDAFAVTNLNCKHFAGSLASRTVKCFEYSDKSDVYKNRNKIYI